jgi:DNA invertase Pin-like site-specific DNA recombinase
MTRRPAVRSPRVIAYTRVSTNEQETGLEVQRTTLRREISHRQWTDVEWITDFGKSARNLKRPGIERALAMLAAGEASVLVVSKLDRLSRSVIDFARVMELASRQGWSLIVLDLGLDLTTPNGEFMAGILAQVAQLERRLIGERTKAALREKKAQGKRLGKPRLVADAVVEYAVFRREEGATLQRIADELNEAGALTARGGRWWPSTVAGLLRSAALDAEAAERRAA